MQTKESNTNRHFILSIIKSGIRIAAGGLLITGNMEAAGFGFVFAEGVGILEEL